MRGQENDRATIMPGMKIVLRLAIVGLLFALLCACGNKGELVQPDRPQSALAA